MITFIQAIARQEGFYAHGSRAQRNSNPGNIEYGKFARTHGGILETIPEGITETPRFACWPTADAGYAAMRALLSGAYTGLTVAQALNKWAPPVENDTSAYQANVCKWTGFTPETVLTSE